MNHMPHRRAAALRQSVWRAVCVLLMLAGLFQPAALRAQETAADLLCAPPFNSAEQLFNCLTPAERVGQLFLVTFGGDSAPPESEVADLILNYGVGGVVLRAQNGNIVDEAQVAALNAALQRYALAPTTAIDTDLAAEPDPAALPTIAPGAGQPRTPLPLLIGMRYAGDGAPYSALHSGGSAALPSAMAIGATWDPALARAAGQVSGQQLRALGVTLLFGPTLTPIDSPNPDSGFDLGTRAFGGDPYWVGLLGRAYSEGIKQGSGGRVAIIANYFPGFAGDGNDAEEVVTVRKSLAQLAQIDLLPFIMAATPVSATLAIDGVLAAHIRYQGFSGNIRDTTPPVSISPTAQAELFGIPALAQWRAQGGLVVSDMLGARAIQRFYDPTGREFPHRQVAKDAFAAGNDLLYLGDFALGAGDSAAELRLANTRDTIRWFQERYRSEPTFQQQVDAAVLRILRRKLALFGPNLSVTPPPAALPTGTPTATTTPVLTGTLPATATVVAGGAALDAGARLLNLPAEAITLLSPPADELAARLPAPPAANEQIVIFTDARSVRQCPTCAETPLLSHTLLAERMLALYGPNASAQVNPALISSFTFDDLAQYLAFEGRAVPPPAPLPTATPAPAPTATPDGFVPTPQPSPTPSPAFLVQEALRNADWVLFAALDLPAQAPQPSPLRSYLAQIQPSADRRVVLFMFGAPYYLNANEILKLSAYFGVYSKGEAFVDTALRVLFRDVTPHGAAPVSVPGVGYDLVQVTQPDPAQRIALGIIDEASATPRVPSREQPIRLEGGDSITLQTGVIVDSNGNPVPDGTLVRFVQEDFSESLLNVLAERPTINGRASYDFALPEAFSGRIRIRASAGDALISDEVNISGNEASVATPTPEPTATPTQTPTPTPEPPTPTPTLPPPTPTPTPTPVPTPVWLEIDEPEGQALVGLLLGLLVVLAATGTAAQLLLRTAGGRVRLVTAALIGALLAYNYLLLELPGSALMDDLAGTWRGLLAVLGGGALGALAIMLRQPAQPR